MVFHFSAVSFGWPKDAADACVAALMMSGHLGARVQGQPVKHAELDHRKIGQADFGVEHAVLTATQKLKVKKLLQTAGYKFPPGDENAAAPDFVAFLKALTQNAGVHCPGGPDVQRPPLRAPRRCRGPREALPGLEGHCRQDRPAAGRIRSGRAAARTRDRYRSNGHSDVPPGRHPHTGRRSEPDHEHPQDRQYSPTRRAHGPRGHYGATLAVEPAKLDVHPAWQALPYPKQAALLQTAGVAALSTPATRPGSWWAGRSSPTPYQPASPRPSRRPLRRPSPKQDGSASQVRPSTTRPSWMAGSARFALRSRRRSRKDR